MGKPAFIFLERIVMQVIDVTDKKGNLIFSVKSYDKKVHKHFLKQFRKIKKVNVIEREV